MSFFSSVDDLVYDFNPYVLRFLFLDFVYPLHLGYRRGARRKQLFERNGMDSFFSFCERVAHSTKWTRYDPMSLSLCYPFLTICSRKSSCKRHFGCETETLEGKQLQDIRYIQKLNILCSDKERNLHAKLFRTYYTPPPQLYTNF